MEVKIHSARDLTYWSRGLPLRRFPFRPFAVVYLDKNEMFSTTVDENGDRCPTWGETGSIPLVGPIDDDTTLSVVIFDARKDSPNKKIGSASLKLKEVVNNEGYDQLAKRTLPLKRKSGITHGKVNVEVLITKPGTAQPDGQPPKKTNRRANGLTSGLTMANLGFNVVDFVEGVTSD